MVDGTFHRAPWIGLLQRTSQGGGGGGSSGGSSGPQPGAPSSCRGRVWECYKLHDISSCAFQKGCEWRIAFQDCYGRQRACDQIEDRYTCVRQIGCEWVDENGDVETSFLTGECVGTPKPCEEFTTMATCTPQTGCFWELGECRKDYKMWSDGRGCANWSLHDISSAAHPEVMMSRCEARDGCQWQGDRYSE